MRKAILVGVLTLTVLFSLAAVAGASDHKPWSSGSYRLASDHKPW
ncbi:MAG TPA: hypothetical protein VD969_01360 [Symbiobacteriaceae bacterium]|nr:hypothetical protein [Symbiobacteriaceae bacterium]